MEKVNHEQRASVGWDVLTDIALKKNLISYGELGQRIGIHHRVVSHVLGLIQEFCLNNQLPPLTILVVNKSGLPGNGFIAWDVDDFEEGKTKVYNENWPNNSNPFEYARNGLTENILVEELLNNPSKSEDSYALVKVRGVAQPLFRQALLAAYDHHCAFCGLTFIEALHAAHIKSWAFANQSERLDVRNGILLCATHHALFDTGYLTIEDDYSISYYDPEESEGEYKKYDSLLSTELHGQKIILPINKAHWPKLEFIKWHREEE